MDVKEGVRRYGLRPVGADLDEVRALLPEHAARERRSEGDGDTELMRLCCVQLFNSGDIDDVLLIWGAKKASFDAACSIDIELPAWARARRDENPPLGQPRTCCGGGAGSTARARGGR
ncbi:hypothetical protein AB0K02_22820 [Streptomyces sp. NPDC049597]|uniref:hypothetical protein n=1 Tax=Streptomyces sp. NPDC049597 TaxID=3155276 RepID=UPI00341EAAD7